MKLMDLVADVATAVLRRDAHVQAMGKTWPLVEYPGGVRKVAIECKQGPMVIESLGGGEPTMAGQVVRNFGKQVLRISRLVREGEEFSPTSWDPKQRGLCLDGAIDGVYVQDVELECTKIILGVKTPGIASLIV